MSKGQTLQDPFLNSLRKDRIPVSIFLVNGIKLQGQIESFDQYVVLLKNTVSQMVYKHAISTVVPARNPRGTSSSSSTGSMQTSGVGYQGSSNGGFDRAGGLGTGFEERGFTSSRSGFNRGGFGQDRGFERGALGQDRGFERGALGQDSGFESPSESSESNNQSEDRFDNDNSNNDNNN